MKDKKFYWAEISLANSDNFSSATRSPFVSAKAARDFLVRNKEFYENYRRRVTFRNIKGELLFADYLGVYYDDNEKYYG